MFLSSSQEIEKNFIEKNQFVSFLLIYQEKFMFHKIIEEWAAKKSKKITELSHSTNLPIEKEGN